MNYLDVIIEDNPVALFGMNERSGSIVQDFQSGFILNIEKLVGGEVLYGEPGLVFSVDNCMRFEDSGVKGSIVLDYTMPHSIEGWFQSNVSTSNEQIIFSNYFSSADWSYQLKAVDFGGQIKLLINTPTGVVEISASGIIFTDGEIYYFTVTFDGNNIFLAINGVERAMALNISVVQSQANIFTIANIFTPTEINSFNGWIDEVGIYDYALTASTWLEHYDAGVHLPVPTQGFREAILATGPIVYLRMGEVVGDPIAVDEVGNVNGIYLGGPALGQAGALAGDSDTSAGFPDSTMYATVQDAILNLTTDLSIALWVKFDLINPGGPTDLQQTLIAKRTNGVNLQTEFLLDMINGNLRYVGSNSSVLSTTLLTDAIWYFIVITRTNDIGTIYINAVLDVQGPLNTPWTNNTPIAIGAPEDFGIPLASVRGVMDEVIFYDRALNIVEIQSIYNSGITPPIVGDDNGGTFAEVINA